MISIPDAPSLDEWVMLMQQDAAQSRQLLIALKARNKKQGLFADPSLEISIEYYERAQRLLTQAATDPEQAERASHLARIGRATVGPFPDREDWLVLIQQDPIFAGEVHAALQTKQAMFGLQTPQAILLSIEAYTAANKELT
jgi:hypothetical protein